MATSMDTESSRQLQVRLVSTKEQFAVATTTLSVPANIDRDGLDKLVHKLLEEEGKDDDIDDIEKISFQFTLMDDFVRGALDVFLSDKGVQNTESVFEINYFDSNPPPEPETEVNHDDWVSGVAARGEFALTACYDNTVSIFRRGTKGAEKLLTIPGHSGPARDVVWISMDEEAKVATFASCSHDQVVMLYKWDMETNAVENMNACKGHERSVDCLAADRKGKYVASGSFDTTLKIWGGKLQGSGTEESSVEGNSDGSKRAKKASSTLTRTPVMTLAGHKEGISGVAFMEAEGEVCTASWDHTIKIWDMEMGGMKTELVGNKSFFDLSYSHLNHTVITASADRTIRLYDPRSKEGVIVRSQFTSHEGWVTCVDWCVSREELFVSGGHDNLVKMWDWRSCRTPLYDLKGHEDKVMCVDWGERGVVASGGADNDMKLFKSNC